MNFGMILIWIAFICGLGATFASIRYNLSSDHRSGILTKKLEILCTLAVALSSLILVIHLLGVNASYEYVYNHSSTDLSWFYRISAFWAGQQGSLLLWALGILVMLMFVRYTGHTKEFAESKLMDITTMVTMAIVSVFLILLIIDNPFAAFRVLPSGSIEPTNWNPFAALYDVPYGQGMNPLLRNPWMAVHPPMLFLGYAAFTIPFAAAVANLITKDSRWTLISRDWMRIAWLFLTLGIGLGGFWAYEVLGWGAWYWTWDPVETSSLIPWITATAYLHAHSRSRFGEYGFLAPLMAIVSFILVIFATFVTRSGIWASVHSWQDFTTEGLIIAIFLVILTGSSIFLLGKRYLEDN
ncbi:cytochrome c biogenesis protein CcsA [Methanolobus sediminis]|uniref:Cytochrome c biogenesis protein CcsA n=1 Tax=Methanolobus sediminis TaxID=3072978 RepID=A0AA51YJN6_9EURY|nr:cytochrome c biogenesis protein CcsA [Methanolobus sediminis]WMW25781.1 cytochrome c biogenesis protein CcsA [Methanolobus sediminis]